jgi:hypothetical protein
MAQAHAMNRADRRRQLREDEKRIARGFDARQPAAGQVVALMRVLDRKLQQCLQRRSVGPLMEFVYSSMASGAGRVGDVPIACGRGCSHCCHSWVDASPAEVLFAVRSMDPGQRARAAQAVGQAYAATGQRGFEERSRMVSACPLLEDNVCSIYDARPIVCRAAVSADEGACRRSFLKLSGESIPVPTVWRTLGQGYAVALEGAIAHAGLIPTEREWNASLNMALGDPTAEARWLGGEDLFLGAPRASESGRFGNPSWAALYKEAFGAFPPKIN